MAEVNDLEQKKDDPDEDKFIFIDYDLHKLPTKEDFENMSLEEQIAFYEDFIRDLTSDEEAFMSNDLSFAERQMLFFEYVCDYFGIDFDELLEDIDIDLLADPEPDKTEIRKINDFFTG